MSKIKLILGDCIGHELEACLSTPGVRRYINKLRCKGMSIISSKSGYKYTRNKGEIKVCYKKLRMRALRAYTAAQQMKKFI